MSFEEGTSQTTAISGITSKPENLSTDNLIAFRIKLAAKGTSYFDIEQGLKKGGIGTDDSDVVGYVQALATRTGNPWLSVSLTQTTTLKDIYKTILNNYGVVDEKKITRREMAKVLNEAKLIRKQPWLHVVIDDKFNRTENHAQEILGSIRGLSQHHDVKVVAYSQDLKHIPRELFTNFKPIKPDLNNIDNLTRIVAGTS